MVAATANGLMSQQETFHPKYEASILIAPDPHPISRIFLPLPGPIEINLLASISVSSLGG